MKNTKVIKGVRNKACEILRFSLLLIIQRLQKQLVVVYIIMFQVVRHAESWDVSALEAVSHLFVCLCVYVIR